MCTVDSESWFHFSNISSARNSCQDQKLVIHTHVLLQYLAEFYATLTKAIILGFNLQNLSCAASHVRLWSDALHGSSSRRRLCTASSGWRLHLRDEVRNEAPVGRETSAWSLRPLRAAHCLPARVSRPSFLSRTVRSLRYFTFCLSTDSPLIFIFGYWLVDGIDCFARRWRSTTAFPCTLLGVDDAHLR